MGGKGELTGYTREYRKGPLSKKDKKELLAIVTAELEEVTTAITVIVMVEQSKKK